MAYSKEDAEILSRHTSNLDKDIYVIHNVPGEVISVLFAYASRSEASFRDNLLKMIKAGEMKKRNEENYFSEAEKKASSFHEKWVVGFGHASVAEHAFLNIAVENSSILFTKIIEDNRLGSYTEKSTRYQVFDRNRYYKPKKIMRSEFGEEYEKTMNSLFDFYSENFPKMIKFVKENYSKPKEMSSSFYEMKCKGKACDAMRYALPAATLTNLGATFNARALAHAITKMLSHPLEEANEIGAQIKTEAEKFLPTLMKAAEKSHYLIETEKALREITLKEFKEEKTAKEKAVKLIHYNKNPEDLLTAGIMYKHASLGYDVLLEKVKKLSLEKKEKILSDFFSRIKRKDAPLRELEYLNYTFEITADFGAFRDLQRHRMCTQSVQLLNSKQGFSVPEEIKETDLDSKFKELMLEAKELNEKIAIKMPFESQYCVPLAFKNKSLFSMNGRELFHIIRLRSAKAGHKSYRKVAQEMYFELKKAQPLIAKHFAVDLE